MNRCLKCGRFMRGKFILCDRCEKNLNVDRFMSLYKRLSVETQRSLLNDLRKSMMED